MADTAPDSSSSPAATNGNGAASGRAPLDDRAIVTIARRAAAEAVRMVSGSSMALERQNLASALAGKSFYDSGTGVYRRDLFQALGYEQTLTAAHYRARYRRGGVARKIVRLPASATWAGGFDLIEDPDPGVETPFEAAAVELFARLDLWDMILRADVLAGLGRYAVLYIGAPGEDASPLQRVTSPEQVLYLNAYGEGRAEVVEEVEDPEDPRYGLPEMYSIRTGSGLTRRAGGQSGVGKRVRKVHWTRIVHVAEGLLEDDVCGEPRLEACWNLLDDLDKVAGGGSESIWLRQKPKFAMKLPPEAQTTDPEGPNYFDAAGAEDEVTEFLHNMRPYLRLHGVELESLENGVPSIAPNVGALLKLLSATTGIPERILTGSERGELASSQDRSNWADRTQERRRFFGEPLVRLLVDRLVEIRALPAPAEPYVVAWPEIDELNEGEKAELAERLSLANERQKKAEGAVLLGINEMRDRIWGLGPAEEIEVEDDPEQGADEGEEEEEPDEDVDRLEAARFRPSLPRLRAAKRRIAAAAVRPPRRAAADRIEGRPARRELALVHGVADRAAPRVLALFLALWAAMAGAVDAEAFERALAQGDPGRATGIVERAINATQEQWRDRVAEEILAVVAEAGEEAAREATDRGAWLRAAAEAAQESGGDWADAPVLRSAAFTAQFNAADPDVIRWAATQSAELITEVTPETILAVRELITKGAAQGVPPRKLAGEIRQVVGLRTDQVDAANNARARLLAGKPGQQIRVGTVTVRVPARGATEAWADRQRDRYRERLRRQRAELIARTETMRAANEGQHQAWRQAVAEGQIPRDQKRVWITAGDGDVRDSHAALEGEVVGLEESYSAGIEPGEEPNCRCVDGLATADDLERAGLA